jgi:bis(5'-nucleosidyl)-tetraphosphatase
MKVRKHSAGVVIVRRFDDGPRYLLLRCFRYWDFPKGEVEPGEDPLATARREVTEETTLTDLVFAWGEDYTQTPPYGEGKVARYYLAECPSGEVYLPVSPELGAPEHQEHRWVDYDEAAALLNDRVRAVLEWADERVGGRAARMSASKMVQD